MRLFLAVLSSCLLPSGTFSQELEPTEGFPEIYSYMVAPDIEDASALQQHIGPGRLWKRGQTLRICFFGGQEPVRELIAQVASEWQQYSGLNFDFGPAGDRRDCDMSLNGFSNIRIGFGSPGYWSFVGTDSDSIPNQYQPSMNFQRFDVNYSSFNGYTSENVVQNANMLHKSTILHEFGHALALLHEHQNTNINCWEHLKTSGPGNVYDYYKDRYGWTESMVKRNLGLAFWSDPDSKSGEYDPMSIMAYMIPEDVLTQGRNSPCYLPQKNIHISDLDKKWIASAYENAPSQLEDEFAPLNAAFSSIPAGASLALKDDFLARIKVDLESSDTPTRREARGRLANWLRSPDADRGIDDMLNELNDGSYRYQLGVAVALRSVVPDVDLSSSALENLRIALDAAEDPVLVGNLKEIISINGE